MELSSLSKETDDNGWPLEVPILEGRNILRKSFGFGQVRHCLVGWINKTFLTVDKRKAVRSALKIQLVSHNAVKTQLVSHNDVMCFTAIKGVTAMPRDVSIHLTNDHPGNRAADLAECWNRAMADLGYTEVQEA